MNDSGVEAGQHPARPHAGGPPEPFGVPSTQGSRRRQRVAYALIGLAVAVGAWSTGMLYGELSGGRVVAVSAAAPVVAPAPTPARAPTAALPPPSNAAAVEGPVAGRGAPPVQLMVPDLGIDQRLIGLRVTADRRLQVPESYAEIGWWSDGPTPGDAGAALLVGHVDSTEGPAVFYDLPSLELGAVIAVRRADGRTVRFAVTDMKSFPKDDFPDELVYRNEGEPSLHLVTCGGSFDRASGHYRDNIVVFADLIEEAPDTTGATAHRTLTDGPAHDEEGLQ